MLDCRLLIQGVNQSSWVFTSVTLELWMIQPKTQLLLIYITLTCLLITLGLFFQPKLLWLALPFVLIVIYSSLDIWIPRIDFSPSDNNDSEPMVDEDVLIDTFEYKNNAESGTRNNTVPTFENFQHIKKALASHQKKFPQAKVHSHKVLDEQ